MASGVCSSGGGLSTVCLYDVHVKLHRGRSMVCRGYFFKWVRSVKFSRVGGDVVELSRE